MGNKLNKRAILSLLAKNEEIVRDIYIKSSLKNFLKKTNFGLVYHTMSRNMQIQ